VKKRKKTGEHSLNKFLVTAFIIIIIIIIIIIRLLRIKVAKANGYYHHCQREASTDVAYAFQVRIGLEHG